MAGRLKASFALAISRVAHTGHRADRSCMCMTSILVWIAADRLIGEFIHWVAMLVALIVRAKYRPHGMRLVALVAFPVLLVLLPPRHMLHTPVPVGAALRNLMAGSIKIQPLEKLTGAIAVDALDSFVAGLTTGPGARARATPFLPSPHSCVTTSPPFLPGARMIERLSLDGRALGDNGAVAVASIIHSSPALHWLSLSANLIGDTGATAIIDAMARAPGPTGGPLRTLYLAQNGIGDVGMVALARLLPHMKLQVRSQPACGERWPCADAFPRWASLSPRGTRASELISPGVHSASMWRNAPSSAMRG